MNIEVTSEGTRIRIQLLLNIV